MSSLRASADQLLLAMGLSSPWMLVGLVLAAIPILIHLFYRRRYEEVRWGAGLFLSKAIRRNAQRNRFQQLLLLILRTLIVVVLVVGFARPLLKSSTAAGSNGGPTVHVFILDDSLSMQAASSASTRFENAKQIIQEVVDAAAPDDQFQILRTSGPANGLPLAGDRDFLKAEIQQLGCTARATDITAALASAEDVLDKVREQLMRKVYVLSDFPHSEWGMSTETARTGLARLAADNETTLINVATDDFENTSVVVSANRGPALVDQRLRIEGVLANYGVTDVTRTVRLSANDLQIGTTTVSVASGRKASFEFPFKPRHAGIHRLLIETDGDILGGDNQFRLVVNALERIPVLLVNGHPSAEPLGNATDFLRFSLAPGEASGWASPWSVRVVTEAEFSSMNLADYRAVFCCNVRAFTPQEAMKLKSYTQSGGALVLSPGDRVDFGNYNSRVLGTGGLLPIRLDRFVGNAAEPRKAFGFDADRLSHPVMSVYRGNPGHGLEQVLNFRYLRLDSAEEKARTVLALENGDPVIMEGPCEAGRVAIVSITADHNRWSTWNTSSGTYATIMNELCLFMLESTTAERSEIVGLPWSRHFNSSVRQVSVKDHRGEVLSSFTKRTSFGLVLDVDPISEPGFVELESPVMTKQVAINAPASESNLRSMTPADLRKELPSRGVASVVAASEFSIDSAADETSPHQVSLWLFVLAAALLLTEQMMASRADRKTWAVATAGFLIAIAALNLSRWQALATLPAFCVAALILWRLSRRRSVSPR